MLAVQTAKATEDIANHNLAVQDSTLAAVEAILHLLNSRTQRPARFHRNIASAAEGTGRVVSDVAGAPTQTRASAEVVRDASEAVDHAVANLRLEVGDFLGKVAV